MGFATALIEVDPLLADAGFFELAKEFTLAIRGKDGLGARGGVFYGDKAAFSRTIVTANVALPAGTWQIGAAIKPGHMNTGFFFSVWYWIIGGLLVLFVGVSVYMIAARPIQLQESVERATADLRVAKEEAEAASQAKSEFLSSMSHELRTPLNAVLGFTQMLEYNTEEPLTKSQQEYATHIKQGGNHLLSLIENVLDLAKIEAGETQISLEDVPPNEVVNECISLVETIARDHGVAISFANSKSRQQLIRADYTHLKQVILNLLANAVKYNRAGGRTD